MPQFDAEHFLLLAKALLTSPEFAQDCCEAKFRSAISRAYYAAFLLGREANGDPAIQHSDLLSWVRSRSREHGEALKRLKTKREDADYNLGVPYDLANAAQECIEDAGDLIPAFRAWSPES